MRDPLFRDRAPIAVALTFLTVVLLAACGDGSTPVNPGGGGPGGGGSIFGNIGGLLGGYTGTGFNSFGQKLDPQFKYLYFNDALPEGNWDCDTDGHCGLGGLRATFGTIAEPDSFLFVSTANLTHNGNNVVVRTSGIESKALTIANPSQYTAVRVSFEFVFASARLAPATHNDSAIVRVKAGTDSASVFKVTAADLQSSKYPLRSGGCGSASIITGRAITYGSCTAWTTATADLTAFKSRAFVLQFIVSEGGQSATDAVDQPTTFLIRKIQLQAAP